MMAALAAGCAFGTAGTAAAHAIQYPVGALTHTPHGLGVATVLPYVMRFNRSSALDEMAEIAGALEVGGASTSREALADAAIDKVTRLLGAIGITPTLATLGLPAERLDWVAEQAVDIERLIKNNPRPIGLTDMRCLLDAAYRGDLDAAASDLVLEKGSHP